MAGLTSDALGILLSKLRGTETSRKTNWGSSWPLELSICPKLTATPDGRLVSPGLALGIFVFLSPTENRMRAAKLLCGKWLPVGRCVNLQFCLDETISNSIIFPFYLTDGTFPIRRWTRSTNSIEDILTTFVSLCFPIIAASVRSFQLRVVQTILSHHLRILRIVPPAPARPSRQSVVSRSSNKYVRRGNSESIFLSAAPLSIPLSPGSWDLLPHTLVRRAAFPLFRAADSSPPLLSPYSVLSISLLFFSFLIATAINRKLASQSSSEVCGGISRNKEKYSSCLSFLRFDSSIRIERAAPPPPPTSRARKIAVFTSDCRFFFPSTPPRVSASHGRETILPSPSPRPVSTPGRSNNFIYKQRRLHRCLSVARDLLRAPGAQSKLANSFPARNFHARLATRYEWDSNFNLHLICTYSSVSSIRIAPRKPFAPFCSFIPWAKWLLEL